MESFPVRPGEIVGGRYRIEKLLGSTGMGAVFLATHIDLEQRVAVKVLLDGRDTPLALKRFRREAKLLGRVASEHVVRVSDYGAIGETTPYIVMEYLEGVDLLRQLREHGALDVTTACEYVLQACEGLANTHAVGVVHRDLKPSNLFIVPRRDGSTVIKIIDFGIAKVPEKSDAESDTLTNTDMLVGTPRYMSPEQTKARPTDAKTDVWSLGVILQELVSAKPVFKAESLPALFVKIVMDAPAPLRSLVPAAPAELENVLFRALEKDPAARLSLLELARGLAPFAGRGAGDRVARIEQLSKLKPPPDSAPSGDPDPPTSSARESQLPTRQSPIIATMQDTATLAPVEPSPSPVKSRRFVAVAGIASACAIATAAIVALTLAQHKETSSMSSSSSTPSSASSSATTSASQTSAPVASVVTLPTTTTTTTTTTTRTPAPTSTPLRGTASSAPSASASASARPKWTDDPR